MVAADNYNHRVYCSWQKLLKTNKQKKQNKHNTQFNNNKTIICKTVVFEIDFSYQKCLNFIRIQQSRLDQIRSMLHSYRKQSTDLQVVSM